MNFKTLPTLYICDETSSSIVITLGNCSYIPSRPMSVLTTDLLKLRFKLKFSWVLNFLLLNYLHSASVSLTYISHLCQLYGASLTYSTQIVSHSFGHLFISISTFINMHDLEISFQKLIISSHGYSKISVKDIHFEMRRSLFGLISFVLMCTNLVFSTFH